MAVRLNLASYYDMMADLWNECLWNHWYVDDSNDDYDLIVPPKSKKHLSRVISMQRFQSLSIEFISHTKSICRSKPGILIQESQRKCIVDIKRKKKRKILILGKIHNKQDLLERIAMGITAEELYWDDILSAPLPKFPDISIRDVMLVWEILASFGKTIRSKFPNDTSVTSISKLIQFAPKFKINELSNPLQKVTKFKKDKIESIIDLCSFKGDLKQDPWIKPIIKLPKDSFCVFIPSLITTNRVRLIESWMRDGGIILNERGIVFEQYVRNEISNEVKSSNYLSETYVSKRSVKLSKSTQEEEIDFIWMIKSLILIGEIKCSFFPSNPIEIYRFYKILDEATDQIKRKTEFVKTNLRYLIEKLNINMDSMKNIEKIKVCPLVITNLPFFSGFPINNVPITDIRILLRYIEGNQKFFITRHPDGTISNKEEIFYHSIDEAMENVLSFIREPPVIKLFKKCLDHEIVPLGKIRDCSKNVGRSRIYVNMKKLYSFNDLPSLHNKAIL